ncbi:MAG: SRPBCC family protein [bacterium]|nr:SRPBCC family protein [bacterium]
MRDSHPVFRRAQAVLLPVFIFLSLIICFFPAGQARAEESELDRMMNLTLHRSVLTKGVDMATLESILQRGEIVVVDETTKGDIPWLVAAGAIINAPPEEVWKTLSDFSRFPEWVPQTEKAISKVTGNRVDVDYTIGFKLGFIHTTINYSVAQRLDPPRRIDWVGTGGDIKKTFGYMELFPAAGGKKTMFFYAAWAVPQHLLLRKFLESEPVLDMMISMSTASVFVKKLKEQIEKNQPAPPPATPESRTDLVKTPVETLIALSSRGPVLLFENPTPEEIANGVQPLVTNWSIFNLPPEQVYQEVADYPQYGIYLPTVDKAEWVKQAGNTGEVEYKLTIQLPILSKKTKYRLSQEFFPGQKINWKYLQGDKFVNSGSWELIPLEGGRKTLGFYRNRYTVQDLGTMANLAMKAIPDVQLAIKAVVSSTYIRATRDWLETPQSAREPLKLLKKKKRIMEIRHLAEERAKKQ